MKKLFALLLSMLLMLSLTACAELTGLSPFGGGAPAPASSSPTQPGTPPESAPPESITPAATPPESTQATSTQAASAQAQDDQKKSSDRPRPELPPIAPAAPAAELTREQFDEAWTLIFGYWNAAGGRYAVIDAMDSNTAVFSAGSWENNSSRDGTVSKAVSEKENEMTLTLLYYATGPTETGTVVIDYANLDQDGKIRIKIGDEDWRHYMFAGHTLEEAHQTYVDNTKPN